MDISIKDPNGNWRQAVDPTQQASRVSIRPLEWQGGGNILGHYQMTAISGTIAASLAAASQLFCVRWADTTKLMVLLRLTVSLGVMTAAQTLANALDLEAVLARAYSANATGGAQITPSNQSQKARSSTMGPSIFASLGEIRMITTAALGAGTQTLDTAGFGYGMYPGNALGVAANVDLYRWMSHGQHPIVLGLNEGFVVRTPTGFGAAATFKAGITMEWAEVPSF